MKNSSSTILWRRLATPLFFALALLALNSNFAFAQTNSPTVNRQLQLWKTFSPANAGFKVSLPDDPQAVTLPYQFADAEVNFKAYQVLKTGAQYGVVSLDLPPDVEKKEGLRELIEQYFTGLSTGLKNNQSVVVLSDKSLSNNAQVGREIVIEVNATVRRMRFYFTKNKYYGLALVTPIIHNAPPELVQVYEAEADKFFNSFQILDNRKSETSSKGIRR